MQYMFEFTGEHRTLPFAELQSVLEAEGIEFEAVQDSPAVGIVRTGENIKGLFNRMALIRSVSKLKYICEEPDYVKIVENTRASFKNFKGTFALDSRRVLGYHRNLSLTEIKKSIGGTIKSQSPEQIKVDMSDPDNIFKIILSRKFYFGKLISNADRKQFETTHGRNRPFFSPISLHPKFARVMINLARVKKGMDLLDPFCGTGGILIEAGSVGLNLYGSDISSKMVEGTKKNLSNYSMTPESLIASDIDDCSTIFKKMDAVVTDPPYGRSASSGGERISELYDRSFISIKKVLKRRRFLVIMLPAEKYIRAGEDHFTLRNQFSVYVHKSLTRHICVYQN